MAMADHLLDRIHTTPRHHHARRPPEGTPPVIKTIRNMPASQIQGGDTIKGQDYVDKVSTQNGDIVVNFRNGDVRHFVPNDRVTVLRRA